MFKLTFINHASYIVETEETILLIDPWVEGFAFDKGWSLIDQSTSNIQLIELLIKKNKKIYIWYSHEHSDHFSVSFLKLIVKKKLNFNVIFQKTIDRRVAKFIQSLNIEVIESSYKEEILGPKLSLITFPFEGGDSYNLTIVDNYTILNLNDCVISSVKQAKKIEKNLSKFSNKINLLMTQFGYANWIGNKSDFYLRKKSAEEKFERIKTQIEILKPDTVVPFASFIYFCHPENFYMNDYQNSPEKLNSYMKKFNLSKKIMVLKPFDEIVLNSNLQNYDENTKNSRIKYWNRLINSCSEEKIFEKKYSNEEIYNEYLLYRKKLWEAFLFIPSLLEKFGFIPVLKIYLNDLNDIYEFSYIRGISLKNKSDKTFDISMNSSTLVFILKNEFGCDTVLVNGKFSTNNQLGEKKLSRHFSPQEYLKNGFGLKNPLISIKVFLYKIFEKIINRNIFIN